MAKTASLTAGLVANKDDAAEAILSPPVVSQSSWVPSTEAPAKVAGTTTDYYKSLTVKLDRTRYEALKSAGLKADKKSQEIFVEALDIWLKSCYADKS